MDQVTSILISLAILAFVVWLFIVLPMQMAGKRHRNRFGWVLMSLLISPLIAIIALAVLGDAKGQDDPTAPFK